MLRTYLTEIRQFPLLNGDQERALGAEVQNGDYEARDQLISSNLPLVVNLAKTIARKKGLESRLSDIIGDGNLGLIRAAEMYDPTLHNRFASFAKYWIKQSIDTAIRRDAFQMTIKRQGKVLLRKYMAEHNRLEMLLGLPPSPTTVIDNLKLRPLSKKALEVILSQYNPNQETVPSPSLLDKSEPVLLAMERQEEIDIVMSRIDKLTEEERTIVYAFTGLDGREETPTMRQLGKEIGMGYRTVCRRYHAALDKLRESA